jgi:ferritin
MNIAIVAVILKSFVRDHDLFERLNEYDTAKEKLAELRECAEHTLYIEQNDDRAKEIVELCDWVSESKLESTFFPEAL